MNYRVKSSKVNKFNGNFFQSLSCMITRIRNKVALIHQSDASPQDNLSADDYQIYEMLPKVDFESLFQHESEGQLEGDASNGVTQNTEESNSRELSSFGEHGTQFRMSSAANVMENDCSLEAGPSNWVQMSSAANIMENDCSSEAGPSNWVQMSSDANIMENDCSSEAGPRNWDTQTAGTVSRPEFSSFDDFLSDNEMHLAIAARKVDTRNNVDHQSAGDTNCPDSYDFQHDNEIQLPFDSRTLVFQNEDEVETYMNGTIIEDIFSEDEGHGDAASGPQKNVAKSSSKTSEPTESGPKVKILTFRTLHVHYLHTARIQTSTRIPDIQKERLVQLVQNNFLKAVGRFAGANGVSIKTHLWANIAKELNKLGPARTADQWKTVTLYYASNDTSMHFCCVINFQTFNGIKASAKAKLADNHNCDNGTAPKSLNRLEEKILAIYGLDSLDGDQRLGEAGFNYKKVHFDIFF